MTTQAAVSAVGVMSPATVPLAHVGTPLLHGWKKLVQSKLVGGLPPATSPFNWKLYD